MEESPSSSVEEERTARRSRDGPPTNEAAPGPKKVKTEPGERGSAALREEEHQTNFESILRPLIQSHLLTLTELGRLLFHSGSKSLMAAAALLETTDGNNEDESNDSKDANDPKKWEPWKDLCLNHWRNEKDRQALSALINLGVSHKSCFQRMVQRMRFPPLVPDPPLPTPPGAWLAADSRFAYVQHGQPPTPSVQPPNYKAADYVIVVHVCVASTKELVFCETLPGTEVPEFFHRGYCSVPLDRTIETSVTTRQSDHAKSAFDVSWHLLRLVDHKWLYLIDMPARAVKEYPYSDNKATINTDICDDGSGSRSDIENQIHSKSALQTVFDLGILEDPNFSATIVARMKAEGICPSGLEDGGSKATLHINRLLLNLRLVMRSPYGREEYHGISTLFEGSSVKLAHYFEGFQEWEDV